MCKYLKSEPALPCVSTEQNYSQSQNVIALDLAWWCWSLQNSVSFPCITAVLKYAWLSLMPCVTKAEQETWALVWAFQTELGVFQYVHIQFKSHNTMHLYKMTEEHLHTQRTIHQVRRINTWPADLQKQTHFVMDWCHTLSPGALLAHITFELWACFTLIQTLIEWG